MISGILRLEGENVASGTSTNLQNVRVAMLQVVCEEKNVFYPRSQAPYLEKENKSNENHTMEPLKRSTFLRLVLAPLRRSSVLSWGTVHCSAFPGRCFAAVTSLSLSFKTFLPYG